MYVVTYLSGFSTPRPPGWLAGCYYCSVIQSNPMCSETFPLRASQSAAVVVLWVGNEISFAINQSSYHYVLFVYYTFHGTKHTSRGGRWCSDRLCP